MFDFIFDLGLKSWNFNLKFTLILISLLVSLIFFQKMHFCYPTKKQTPKQPKKKSATSSPIVSSWWTEETMGEVKVPDKVQTLCDSTMWTAQKVREDEKEESEKKKIIRENVKAMWIPTGNKHRAARWR